MRNATLVFSGRTMSKPLSSTECCDQAVDKFFGRVFQNRRSSRVEVRNGRYFYTPSKEYKEYVLRMKILRKAK